MINLDDSPNRLVLDIRNTSNQLIDIRKVIINVKNSFLFFFPTQELLSEQHHTLNPNKTIQASFDLSDQKNRFGDKRFTIIIKYNNGSSFETISSYLNLY